MEKQKLSESAKIKLSVALATFNEEEAIGGCLESVKGIADEIIIVDGSSEDKTVQIAKTYGARVEITDNKPIFHINKQKAMAQCRGEWILQMDADERLTPELANEIKSIVDLGSDYSAFWIKRKKMFLGQWIKKGGHYPDPVIRLFKRGKARLPCKSVHEQMEVEGRVGWLENHLIHFPTTSFTVYITKDNRYSTLMAKELLEESVPINFVNFVKYMFWKPQVTFFSLFLRHRGFVDGFPGFVFALYSGIGIMSSYVKYWEMKKTGNDSVKQDWV